MADTDFYKKEIARQQEKLAEYQRLWLEAVGLLSQLSPHMAIDETDIPLTARRIFDRVSALKNAYNASVADCMFYQGALDEIISAANIELTEAWVDLSEGCGENSAEFSLFQSSMPRFVKYLKQRQCCGDARCYNESSGVPCPHRGSPLTELTKALDAEGVYDRKLDDPE